LKNKGRFENMT